MRRIVPLVLLLTAAMPALAQQTREELKYAPELKACDQRQNEAERKACQDAVQAKIKAEWRARIQEESRRQTHP